LIVRLRNWVGDVTLALPMLQRLADAGFAPVLVGKSWARDLLAGTGWPVHGLPKTTTDRVALLRRLRDEARAADPRFRAAPLHALCLPDSFSSALEFRLAGLRALGHAWEGRRLLLGRAVPRPRDVHELAVYWRLGDALLGAPAPLPAAVNLRPTEAQQHEAAALRAAHGLPERVIVICPFAGGTWNQQDKTWPGFAEFVATRLPALGLPIVVCPGPGEEERIAREHFAGACLLPGVNLGVYAALLSRAAAMVSNDTGPAHMAAAVGTPLISVMGPSDPTLWRPWGPDNRVSVLGGHGRWPDEAAVLEALRRAISTTSAQG
jgi:ADP-heptose:LPS heptosyltransferase